MTDIQNALRMEEEAMKEMKRNRMSTYDASGKSYIIISLSMEL